MATSPSAPGLLPGRRPAAAAGPGELPRRPLHRPAAPRHVLSQRSGRTARLGRSPKRPRTGGASAGNNMEAAGGSVRGARVGTGRAWALRPPQQARLCPAGSTLPGVLGESSAPRAIKTGTASPPESPVSLKFGSYLCLNTLLHWRND